MREQPVPRLLVPRRHLHSRRRRQNRQLLHPLRHRRRHVDRRRRPNQHSAVAVPRKTRIQKHLHRARLLQLRKVPVQDVDRIPVDLRRVRVRVHRQKIAPLVLQPRHPVTRVEHHHVRAARRVQVTPQQPLVTALVAERRFHLRLVRVPQVDHVLRVEAEHVQHVALERFRVPMCVRHLRHPLMPVAPVAHDQPPPLSGCGTSAATTAPDRAPLHRTRASRPAPTASAMTLRVRTTIHSLPCRGRRIG